MYFIDVYVPRKSMFMFPEKGMMETWEEERMGRMRREG